MPVNDGNVPKVSRQTQRDYVTYLAGQIRALHAGAKVYVSYSYGESGDLDQAPVADLAAVDGVTLTLDPVRKGGLRYGIGYDANLNGLHDVGEGPDMNSPEYKLLDKDQLDYFIR